MGSLIIGLEAPSNARSHSRSGSRSPAFAKPMMALATASRGGSTTPQLWRAWMAVSNAMPKRRVVSGSNLSPSRYCLSGIGNPASGNGEAGPAGPPLRSWRIARPSCLRSFMALKVTAVCLVSDIIEIVAAKCRLSARGQPGWWPPPHGRSAGFGPERGSRGLATSLPTLSSALVERLDPTNHREHDAEPCPSASSALRSHVRRDAPMIAAMLIA